MTVIFITLGAVVAAKLPGSAPSFYLEIPPMRMPKLSNVLVKTYSRMHWYFVEILPRLDEHLRRGKTKAEK